MANSFRENTTKTIKSTVQSNSEINVMKRKRLSSCSSMSKSTDSLISLSNSVNNATDSGSSCESDFEEHDYCSLKRNRHRLSPEIEVSNKDAFLKNTNSNHIKFRPIMNSRNSKPKCNTKNAVLARINRLKKKQYVEHLEKRNTELETENEALKDLLSRKMKEVNSLKRETSNLHSVIKNSTEIGSLLKCIRQNTNLEISSSLLNKESTFPQDKTNDSFSQFSANLCSPGNENDVPIEEGNKGLNNFACHPTLQMPAMMTDIIDENQDIIFDNPAINDPSHLTSMLENPFCQLDQSEIMTETKLGTEFFDSDSFLRCETPTKGFDELCNKENLFDNMGVCFHISNKKVSLEFCDTCNVNAAG